MTKQDFLYSLLVAFSFICCIKRDLNKLTLEYLLESYCKDCNSLLANRNSIFIKFDYSKRFLNRHYSIIS